MIGRCRDIISAIFSGELDASFAALYGKGAVPEQKRRYLQLLNNLVDGDADVLGLMVSAPGRTELGGNHTDHNNGNVLAAAVDLDCVAAVAPINTAEIILISDEYQDEIRIDLTELEPQPDEYGTAEALVRGMASVFYQETGQIGGVRGYLSSTCKPGTGLSSSAAFSVLIGGILNFLYGAKSLSAERIAHLAKEAENRFFGKPCGLMDQMSSSVGGTLAIDFLKHDTPIIHRVAVSAAASGYKLMVIDTGGSHIELTADYAAIPNEIRRATEVFGRDVARGLTREEVIEKLPLLRERAGDRAVLRLLHFIEENDRAVDQATALKNGDFTRYLELAGASGESSAMLLQNCSSSGSTTEQGILLALALTKLLCPSAVARVHGGGFAGTIQVYVPEREVSHYTEQMENVFGRSSVIPLLIGRPGVIGLNGNGLIATPCECGEDDATAYND